MPGSVRTAAFGDGGKALLTCGGDGVVYHWDMRTQRCVGKHVDEGCMQSTALTVAPTRQLFACGSGAGVVNLYSSAGAIADQTPVKSFMNLTTQVIGSECLLYVYIQLLMYCAIIIMPCTPD